MSEERPLNIYQKLAKARTELQKRQLKKGSENNHLKYKYFTLGDFMIDVNEIFEELGLSYVSGFKDSGWYNLLIMNNDNPMEVVTTGMPVGEAIARGQNEMQNIGSQETYCRRYRFIALLGIVENDVLEEQTGEKATKEQIKQIEKLYEQSEIFQMLYRLKCDELKDVTYVQAEKMIQARKDRE